LGREARCSFDILYELTCVLPELFRRLAWRGKQEAEISNNLEMPGMEETIYKIIEGFEERAMVGETRGKNCLEDFFDN